MFSITWIDAETGDAGVEIVTGAEIEAIEAAEQIDVDTWHYGVTVTNLHGDTIYRTGSSAHMMPN